VTGEHLRMKYGCHEGGRVGKKSPIQGGGRGKKYQLRLEPEYIFNLKISLKYGKN